MALGMGWEWKMLQMLEPSELGQSHCPAPSNSHTVVSPVLTILSRLLFGDFHCNQQQWVPTKFTTSKRQHCSSLTPLGAFPQALLHGPFLNPHKEDEPSHKDIDVMSETVTGMARPMDQSSGCQV